MRQVLVTAGVIHNEQGRLLIAQRKPEAHAGLLWEFPGGRLEAGEHPEVGLARELQEELGIAVQDLKLFDVVSHIYAEVETQVVLLVYMGRLASGSPQTIECNAFAWVNLEGLGQYDFSAADRIIVARLRGDLATEQR